MTDREFCVDAADQAAAAAGLTVVARGQAPVPDEPLPGLRGFTGSSFSAVAAAAATACLTGRAPDEPSGGTRTAVLLVSVLGDVSTAQAVASAVDRGERISPQLFFMSVPNSVIGHISARWGLTGPVICTSPIGQPLAEGMQLAAQLVKDGESDHSLLILIDPVNGTGEPYEAAAFLLTAPNSGTSTDDITDKTTSP
ncbi:hypothetical protein OG985_46520 [Streptomyces sp. NBC_00289]|uniref:hypothetical protein n=1 Tax=Streptomyces sp. NBC_00289 TaxID=2975703 RepID=UPI00324484A8